MPIRLFTLPLLALALSGATASAQPTYKEPYPADYKAPKVDLEKWAARIRKLCPAKGWTVSVENNDVVIRRDTPVRFYDSRKRQFSIIPSNAGNYRLRLRFAPPLSLDKYEELEAQNRVAETEDALLRQKYPVMDRVYSRIADSRINAVIEKQTQEYRDASKHLVFHRLPDFYTMDYSLTLYQSWRSYESVNSGDLNIDDECNRVKDSLARYFGNYSREVAAEGATFGLEETSMP